LFTTENSVQEPCKSWRKTGILFRPSEELIRFNNKKDLLPFEIEEYYKKNYKRNKSHHNEFKTSDRIFTEYVLSRKTKKLKKSSSSNKYPYSIGHINELITYKDGPNFRKEVRILIL